MLDHALIRRNGRQAVTVHFGGLTRGGRALRRRRLVGLCLLVALALPPAAAQATTNDLDLVSRASGAAGAKGNDDAFQPVPSGDGRFVAFASFSSNLHPDDGDSTLDVFVRDLQTNANTLVSRATGASGAKGNSESFVRALSRDGRFVAFDSLATNLDPADSDAIRDVFVRDLQANTTTLVSRASGSSGAKGNTESFVAALSDDGRFVAFVSAASNLHADDGDTVTDVYVRDLETNTTTLVSRASGATGAKANGQSLRAAISGDGRFVAFDSEGSNLHPDDPEGTADVFVRDLQTGTTTLVSRATGATGVKGNASSSEATISGDGRFVAFASIARNLHPDDVEAVPDVFVRDLQTNTTRVVSRATGATGVKGNASSSGASISGDGRFVAFDSGATNLHPADTDTGFDVFVRDLQTNTTTLVSRAAGSSGVKGNGSSGMATVSGDGRFVVFASRASNLHPDDGDTIQDAFRRQVRSEPAARADAYLTAANTPLTVGVPGVLRNDSDADGDPLSAQLVSGSA